MRTGSGLRWLAGLGLAGWLSVAGAEYYIAPWDGEGEPPNEDEWVEGEDGIEVAPSDDVVATGAVDAPVNPPEQGLEDVGEGAPPSEWRKRLALDGSEAVATVGLPATVEAQAEELSLSGTLGEAIEAAWPGGRVVFEPRALRDVNLPNRGEVETVESAQAALLAMGRVEGLVFVNTDRGGLGVSRTVEGALAAAWIADPRVLHYRAGDFVRPVAEAWLAWAEWGFRGGDVDEDVRFGQGAERNPAQVLTAVEGMDVDSPRTDWLFYASVDSVVGVGANSK